MEVIIPPEVKRIITRLNSGGYEAYVVGGCVRDSIMRLTPKDWDVTTSAEPTDIKRLFKRTYDTGIAHGTVTVSISGKSFEVTTYRIDGEYTDSRHPASVEFSKSLHADLTRRDFTMNAIAYHSETGFVDPFGGIPDIKAGIVRGVGDPGARFCEDALRMLRAIRFSAQLGFSIDPATWAALEANARLISHISMERVRDELIKLLMSAHPDRLRELSRSGLMSHIDPGLAAHITAFDPTPLSGVTDTAQKLAVLLRGLSGVKDRLKHFRLDNKTIGLVTVLLTELEIPVQNDHTHIRRRLAKLGPGVFSMLLDLFAAYGADTRLTRAITAEILTRGDCISLSGLALKGGDLKSMGITDGREIGRTLERLFMHVLEHPEDNTSQTLKAIT